MKQYLLAVMKGQQRGLLPNLVILILWPLALMYGLGVCMHRGVSRLQGGYQPPKPVISIGNITVGGSGKTPLVIWLVGCLRAKGFKPVILTRGYMPKASKISDEVDMINEQLQGVPVLAGADRAANIQKSCDTVPADVYIADDAFQHWPLRRSLDIVAIDTGNPFGNGHLLPAGILREPLSALKRADILVLTKVDGARDMAGLYGRIKAVNPGALIVESRYQSTGAVDVLGAGPLPENFLQDRRVAGFCAIGDPSSFELSIKNSGAKSVKLFSYMDHHTYLRDEVKAMVDFCHTQKVDVLVTTHKDAVKLRIFSDLFTDVRLVYIPIQLEIIKGSDEFIQKVISICRH